LEVEALVRPAPLAEVLDALKSHGSISDWEETKGVVRVWAQRRLEMFFVMEEAAIIPEAPLSQYERNKTNTSKRPVR